MTVNTDFGTAAFWIAIVTLIVLCSGNPDIIDGWAKRLNETTCVE